jgi:hypothetical protein
MRIFGRTGRLLINGQIDNALRDSFYSTDSEGGRKSPAPTFDRLFIRFLLSAMSISMLSSLAHLSDCSFLVYQRARRTTRHFFLCSINPIPSSAFFFLTCHPKCPPKVPHEYNASGGKNPASTKSTLPPFNPTCPQVPPAPSVVSPHVSPISNPSVLT